MAVAESMSQDDAKNEHEQDMVMPGFRFHPTEEELVEFYLRRKVEGKRFNVELITLIDLYRYDPWELPALATIGEKEWFFYVPRDRKYRNGDRPNRVTSSGYWKATGADRMIRAENFHPIGLKKTLVFYSGKAPKGIRTSWIMNEYRLPQHETERLQKAEISLCRVYKRPGVEDHPSLPRSVPTRASSSGGAQSDKTLQQDLTNHVMERFQAFGGQSQQADEKMSETSGSSSTDVRLAQGLSKDIALAPLTTTPSLATSVENHRMFLDQPKQTYSLVPSFTTIFTGPSLLQPISSADDFHRLVSYQQALMNQQQQYQNHHDHPFQISTLQQPQAHCLALNTLPGSHHASAFSDRLWDWNSNEASKEYTSPFK